MERSENTVRIDLDAVLRERLPRHSRYIPKFAVNILKRIVCQDKLNWLLDSNRGKNGAEFCAGVLHDLNVSYEISGTGNLPAPADSHVIYVCNHPLGALDGIAIIDMVARRHPGKSPRFIVNDLLSVLTPLKSVFVPINKHGAQSRENVSALTATFESDDPVIVFPAGLVSRKMADGKIRDLQWQKMFASKSAESRRDIIPLHFDGHNSAFFYNFAKFRTAIGLKFNYEMVLLPGEVFRCTNRKFTISVGRRIPYHIVADRNDPAATAADIYSMIYAM